MMVLVILRQFFIECPIYCQSSYLPRPVEWDWIFCIAGHFFRLA